MQVPRKLEKAIAYLSRFTEVKDEELMAMWNIMHFASFPKNEVLLRQGDMSRQAAFLIKGAIRVYYVDHKGIDHTLDFIFENEPMFSIESFFSQLPSPISIVTLEPVELIYTSHDELTQFLASFPKYDTVLRQFMSEMIVIDGVHNRLLRISNSRERYEAFCEMRPGVIQRVPLKYIASYLEMALETLSRVRAGKL